MRPRSSVPSTGLRVRDVHAHLHRGFAAERHATLARSSCPRPPPGVKQRLVEAASSLGLDPQDAEAFVRATLAAFTARLPEDERRQLVAHLPEDVRLPLRRATLPDVSEMRTVDQLVDVTTSAAGPGIRVTPPPWERSWARVRRPSRRRRSMSSRALREPRRPSGPTAPSGRRRR